MALDLVQIQDIIKFNPAKDNVEIGRKMNKFLSAVVYGEKAEHVIKQSMYFESSDIFKERKDCMTNTDLFERLMRKEKMVFTARGGSRNYNDLSESQIASFKEYLNNIRFGYSLTEWIENICLNAYNTDPMGVILIEKSVDGKQAYPTYQPITSIYDYKANSRVLDYCVFSLDKEEAEYFLNIRINPKEKSNMYRVICDTFDRIVKYDGSDVTIIDEKLHGFGKCPVVMMSDIVDFKNTQIFKSKIYPIAELGASYMINRSLRDLTRKYHGFPKAVEPLVKCTHCNGTGFVDGKDCPKCHGTTWAGIETIADKIKLSPDIIGDIPGFDIHKIFAYVTTPIEILDKQDNALNDTENLMSDTYYGTDNRKYTSGVQLTDTSVKETATKTLANLQPIYTRLEQTAKWGENTEMLITNFIGIAMFPSYKSSSINWGKDYILETSQELFERYSDQKLKGCPIFDLNDSLEVYFMSKYQSSPIELSIAIKLMRVEPFIHYTVAQCQTMTLSEDDMKRKIYFSEWYNELDNNDLINLKVPELKKRLDEYIVNKQLVTETKTLVQ